MASNAENGDAKATSLRGMIGLIFRGMAIGSANVIPGVSGGTIALITGIYPQIINSIKSFGWKTIKLLLKGQLCRCFHEINGSFIAPVGIGILASIFTLAKALDHLLANHITLTMSFFFGLILASVHLIYKQISKWNWGCTLTSTIGICLAGLILLIEPLGENPNPIYIFLCGIIAMSSMILPGISGSFILILMGNYALVLGAVSNIRDLNTSLPIVLPFVGGCAIGLVGFTRILSIVLDKFKATTMALLTGFIIGSLAVIWPWKIKITTNFSGKEKVTGYEWHLPLPDKMFLLAILMMLAGAGLVLILEKIASDTTKEEKNR